MKMANKMALLLAIGAALATATALIPEEVTCQDAVTTLMPCLEFVTGKGPATPSAPCCVAIHKVREECALKPDRVKVCQCLKDAATKFGVDVGRIKSLPGLCMVQLPFPIVPDIDCSKIP